MDLYTRRRIGGDHRSPSILVTKQLYRFGPDWCTGRHQTGVPTPIRFHGLPRKTAPQRGRSRNRAPFGSQPLPPWLPSQCAKPQRKRGAHRAPWLPSADALGVPDHAMRTTATTRRLNEEARRRQRQAGFVIEALDLLSRKQTTIQKSTGTEEL